MSTFQPGLWVTSTKELCSSGALPTNLKNRELPSIFLDPSVLIENEAHFFGVVVMLTLKGIVRLNWDKGSIASCPKLLMTQA